MRTVEAQFISERNPSIKILLSNPIANKVSFTENKVSFSFRISFVTKGVDFLIT